MQTIRLLADSKNQSRTLTDARTQERLFWWRGSDLRIEIALADAGKFLPSSAVGTITVEIKEINSLPSDPALARRVYGSADCDSTFTAADWRGGVKSLIAANFDAADIALDPGEYRLIIRHEGLADGSGFYVREPATGSIAFSGAPANGNTVTIGSRVITWVTGTPGANQIQIDTASPAPIRAATNAQLLVEFLEDDLNVEAVRFFDTVNLTARVPGADGNAIALARTGTAMTVSGATLTGGTTTPAAPKNTYCSTAVTCLEDQSESDALSRPPIPASDYWTKWESDSRYEPIGGGGGGGPAVGMPILASEFGVLISNSAAANNAGWANLIAAAQAEKRNIHFDGSGTYNFSTALTISESGITISGENAEFTRLVQTNNSANLFNISLGGSAHGWGVQTRRITFSNINLYGNGLSVSSGRGVNADGSSILTAQAMVFERVTIRGFAVGYYNRRCDQTTMIDCVVAYNGVGIDYNTSAHSLTLINTGIARSGTVGIIAAGSAGCSIIGGDFGNQPLDIKVAPACPLTLIGSNHESNLGGTEVILVENNAKLIAHGTWFLKGGGIDVPRFRVQGGGHLTISGIGDSGDYTTPMIVRDAATSVVVGTTGGGLAGGTQVEHPNGQKYNLQPWSAILSNSGLFSTANAATANNLYTVLDFTAGGPSHLVWHSPGDNKAWRLNGILYGSADPTGAVVANPGTLYLRSGVPGEGKTLYVKESATTAAGWVPVRKPINAITKKTAAYTATDSDRTILCDATSGAFTVTLPSVSFASGLLLTIKKIDASGNAITIDGFSTEVIDGATTKALATQWASLSLHCDGTAWFVV